MVTSLLHNNYFHKTRTINTSYLLLAPAVSTIGTLLRLAVAEITAESQKPNTLADAIEGGTC